MYHFFIFIHTVSPCSSQQTNSFFSILVVPIIVGIAGAAGGYWFARKNLRFERNADFQKMLDEEQLHAHKKLYAAAKSASVRKENPFSMAYRQKDGKVFLRRSQTETFINDITAFLSSEDGAFIDRELSHPLWGLRNLVFAVLNVEKDTGTIDIELEKKGDVLVAYIEKFRNNFRNRFQLRDRKIRNIDPE